MRLCVSRFRSVIKSLFAVSIFVTIAATRAYAAGTKYERVEQLFLEGNYSAVVTDCVNLIKSGYGRRDDIYYLKALSELKLNRFNEARNDFEYIISRYPRTQKAFDSYVGVGDSYMLAGDLNSAIGAYNRVPDEFPADRNLPVVYSRIAGCYKGLGLKEKSEYYSRMANKSTPVNYDLRGATAPPPSPARSTGGKMPAERQATASRARVAEPVTNIIPKNAKVADRSEYADLVLATSGEYSVQVGSFKNRNNAEKLAGKLASSGYESRVEMPVGRYDKLYRVKIGNMSSAAQAEVVAARLRASGYSTKICDGQD